MKYGNLNFLEPSGPFQACNGTDLPFTYNCRSQDPTDSTSPTIKIDVPGDLIPVGRGFLPFQTGPGVQPPSCTMGTESFPGLKYGRGVLLTIHPLLVPRSWKSGAIPLPTL